jgi:hypothetical protein
MRFAEWNIYRMPTYATYLLTGDPGLQVSSVRSVGPSGPTQSVYFCVNQGVNDGVDGVYRLGLTTGSYSQLYGGRLVQSIEVWGDTMFLSTGDGPYLILSGDRGLTSSLDAAHTASNVVWGMSVDGAAGQLRFTEEFLVRSLPLGGGTATTLATFSYWIREVAVDPSTGDIWAHAQDPDYHMIVRLDQADSWSASVAFATSSYIGGLGWSATHSAPVFTCGLNSWGVFSLSGATALPLSLDLPWASTYSAWKSLSVGESGDIFLGSLVFGTGETASHIARLVP